MAISKPGTHSWPRLIAQWRLSGLTQAEFCARRGISLPTFRYHLYKPRRRSGSPRPIAATDAADHSALSPRRLLPSISTRSRPILRPPLEVILADGLRIAVAPGFDPQTLRRLVDALRQPPC